MLAKRVIPSVLVRGKTAYKGPGFGDRCTRSVGSAISICRTHARRGVDELLILDIGATPDKRGPDLELVGQLAAECYIPITVGGGVQRMDDIDHLLRAGADKVAICSCANFGFIREASEHFGRQAIVGVVEHELGARVEAKIQAQRLARAGAGEIILQCTGNEATLEGYDLEVATIAKLVDVPIVVSGGCKDPADMLAAFKAGADACAAGALFAFTDWTPRSCAQYLSANGIEVRL